MRYKTKSKEFFLIFLVATLFSFSYASAYVICDLGYCTTNITLQVNGTVYVPQNLTNITIHSPIQGTTYYVNVDKLILFNATVSDADGVDTLWYSLDGGSSNVTLTNATWVHHPSIGYYTTLFCANDTFGTATCISVSYRVASASGGGGGGGPTYVPPTENDTYYTFLQQTAFTGMISNISEMMLKYNEWVYGVDNVITIQFLDRNGNLYDVIPENIEVKILNNDFEYTESPILRLSQGTYIKNLRAERQNATTILARVVFSQGNAYFSKTIDLTSPSATQMDILASQVSMQVAGFFGDNWLKVLVGISVILAIGLGILILNLLTKKWK